MKKDRGINSRCLALSESSSKVISEDSSLIGNEIFYFTRYKRHKQVQTVKTIFLETRKEP